VGARNSILFAVILNVFLSRNLDQSMLKNAYFLGKNCKNCLSVGGSAPETSLLHPPSITTLSSSFLVVNAFYYAQKSTK